MRRLSRWLAAGLAAVLFATATLHILSHPDLTEAGCVVCHMQEASLPGAPAPVVVAVESPPTSLAETPLLEAASIVVRAAPARAPPAVLS